MELGDPDVAMSHGFDNAEYDVGYVGKWHLAGGGTHGDNPIPAEKRAGYDDYTEFDFAAPDGYAERYSNPHVPGDPEGMPGFWYESLPGYYGMCRRIDGAVGARTRE